MPAKVTLKVTEGKLTGQESVFDERSTCIIGRDDDCQPRVPKDDDHKTISRRHCLLDINPPDIRVRDFGSMNGTSECLRADALCRVFGRDCRRTKSAF